MSKHQTTLEAIYSVPTRANISWKDVESLLKSLGATITEGKGSRVRIHLNGVRAVFHRPHPRKETDRGAVRAMQRFLLNAGIGSP
ncbi:MAG: type II toxin-antitoxin system HicA family toxin [Planctomycetes bacterium]|nr:type II toxin-antitoxin system HicA family toxin [Planctomycetota bacterium]